MKERIDFSRVCIADCYRTLSKTNGVLEFDSKEYRVAAFAFIQAYEAINTDESRKGSMIDKSTRDFRSHLAHMFKESEEIRYDGFMRSLAVLSSELDRLEGKVCTIDQCTDRRTSTSGGYAEMSDRFSKI